MIRLTFILGWVLMAAGSRVISGVDNRMSFTNGGVRMRVHLSYSIQSSDQLMFSNTPKRAAIAFHFFNETNESLNMASSVFSFPCKHLSAAAFLTECPLPDIRELYEQHSNLLQIGPYRFVEPLIATGNNRACKPTFPPSPRLCYRIEASSTTVNMEYKDVNFITYINGKAVDVRDYFIFYHETPKISSISLVDEYSQLEIKGHCLAGNSQLLSSYDIKINRKECLINTTRQNNETNIYCYFDKELLEAQLEGLETYIINVSLINGLWEFKTTIKHPKFLPPNHKKRTIIIVSTVVPTVLVLGLVTAIALIVRAYYLKKKRKHRQFVEEMEDISLFEKSQRLLSPHLKQVVQQNLLQLSNIDFKQKELGSGYYGVVRIAELNLPGCDKQEVAVKMMQNAVSEESVKEFYLEAILMLTFDHPNVLKALGIAKVGNIPAVALPLMDAGDLSNYVVKHASTLTEQDVINFALQIAKGARYLSVKRIVHRDLAARNCLLNSDRVVKIADFGLARFLDDNDSYTMSSKHRPLPIRWMAPESFCLGEFSTESDVWSFGITFWELATKGDKPYKDQDMLQIKDLVCNKKYRLPQENISDESYDIMLKCWEHESSKRLKFTEIIDSLQSITSQA